MPGKTHRGIMGTIFDKVVSAVHKRANNSLHRRGDHHVRPQPRRALHDHARDIPRRPPPRRDRDRGQTRQIVRFESDSSFSSTDYSSDSSNESSLTEPKRYVDERFYDPGRNTYRDRGRGPERQEPESESTHGRDVHHALPSSRVPFHPAEVQAELDWPLTKSLSPIPVPQPQVARNWPLTAATIPSGAIAWEPTSVSSQPGEQNGKYSDDNTDIKTQIANTDDASQSTKLDGESGSDSDLDSNSESNISFDEWEDPEEYQRRLSAKQTKKDKSKGRVMQTGQPEAEAGPSRLPAPQVENPADNRPMSGASTAPSWLEEVMSPYYSISNVSRENMNKVDRISGETPTREQIKEDKRAEKPVHLGQIRVEEYHASPAARSHSIRRKPVGNAPSRKTTTADTIPNSSRNLHLADPISDLGSSREVIPECNQIFHVRNEETMIPKPKPNFSYPLRRDLVKGQPQPQAPSEKKQRPRLDPPGPESNKTPADDVRHMEQPRYNYMWDR